MKFYHSLAEFNTENKPCVATIGMFDGVHKGHISVLEKVIEISTKLGIPSVVLTFSNHPASYFNPNQPIEQLSTLLEKEKLLKKIGIDILIALPFDSYLADLSATDFAKTILIQKLNTKHLVFGYDNHFGRNREGSIDFINTNFKYINTYKILETVVENEIVSSTLVKSFVQKGQIEQANGLLNYIYSLTGIIVKGDQLGRTIGFPTANLELKGDKLIPAQGVYLTKSKLKDRMIYGMTNIGIRPTVSQSNKLRIETHLFNFNEEIYGEELEVHFLAKMRDEIKFNSFADLINQLNKDKIDATNRLAQIHITT